MLQDQDTIAAVSTPSGYAGIGVIRVSGPDAHRLISKISRKTAINPREAVYTVFLDSQQQEIDRGILLRFDAPHSFTGEDMIELQGHGNPILLGLLLECLCKNGARLAAPGEFSRRAFENGKYDLLELEAVATLIQSTNRRAVYAAQRVLQGKVSEKLQAINQQIKNLRVATEAAIDFSDEEIEIAQEQELKSKLSDILSAVKTLRNHAEEGVKIASGGEIAIVGKPNVGKSTLVNALVEKDVSIISKKAGTTRDIIRTPAILNGTCLTVIDTAGLNEREIYDPIEKEGIKRTIKAVKNADISAIVADLHPNTDELKSKTARLLTEISKYTANSKMIVLNKSDTVDRSKHPQEESWFGCPLVVVSAKTGFGIEKLKQTIRQACLLSEASEDDFTARQRHVEALDQMIRFLSRALENVGIVELFAEDIRLAQKALGTLTGEETPDDLLGDIFSTFCIGK